MTEISSHGPISERIRGALVGLAIGDALGAPVEFKERGTFGHVSEMQPGGYFRLPAGAWTDDTAMALCLADSLLYNADLDPRDLLNRFLRWVDVNENTSTGRCLGIGQNTFVTLGQYRRTGNAIASPVKGRSDGNGSLMRVAPIACRHWLNRAKARRIARNQSYTTHASDFAAAACEAMTLLQCTLIAGAPWRQALADLHDLSCPDDIAKVLRGSWQTKSIPEIRSSGYVVDTLEAALWAVDTTLTFEDAVVKAVNLGHDADTVGAVTGQLAGALYGIESIPLRWQDTLLQLPNIDQRALALMNAALSSLEQ
jgi:ADP-ribosyl-[dinitrogen reductase] hydrolase